MLTFSNSLFILFRIVIMAWCLGDETPKRSIWVFREDGMYGVHRANFGVRGVRARSKLGMTPKLMYVHNLNNEDEKVDKQRCTTTQEKHS